MEISIKHTKRIFVTVFGFIILGLGIIMLVTPGPGWLFIVLGLGVLATEYVWAHHLLKKAKHHYTRTKDYAVSKIKKAAEANNK